MKTRSVISLLLLCLVSTACHIGPYYDIHESEDGPHVSHLVALLPEDAGDGSFLLADLLDLIGPPTRVSRREDTMVLLWDRNIRDRHAYGVGIGLLGFNLQFFEHETSRQPTRELMVLVEDDIVIGIGNTLSGVGLGTP